MLKVHLKKSVWIVERTDLGCLVFRWLLFSQRSNQIWGWIWTRVQHYQLSYPTWVTFHCRTANQNKITGHFRLKGDSETKFTFCISCRELFLHEKAMVPYVQLSTNCRIGFWCNEKYIFDCDKIIKPTVGWQLHIRYHRLPNYKEFPHFIGQVLIYNTHIESPPQLICI